MGLITKIYNCYILYIKLKGNKLAYALSVAEYLVTNYDYT